MKPVLFSIGDFPITSFGVLLVLALLLGSFMIWRIIRLYDVEAEKVFDLIFLTLIGGVLGARLYYILTNLNKFDSPIKVLDIFHHPGLPFWGAFLGGFLTLMFFIRKFKIQMFQVLDISTVGFFIALSISSLGCFFGSCEYGVQSNLGMAVPQVGVIGRRLPLQFFQAGLSFLVFLYLWKTTLRFHVIGQIFALGLIFLGIIKLGLEPFRPPQSTILGFNLSYIYGVLLLVAGFWIFYKRAKKSIINDLGYTLSLIWNGNRRKNVMHKFNKRCYNLLVRFRFGISKLQKSLLRLLNIKSNPNEF
jgi:phosphatidylglycerol---prolipoprotein diacylglyceryl transferase